MDLRALPQPVTIYETMGRDVGWLAGASILGKLDEKSAPHLVYLPERPFDQSEFLSDLDVILKKNDHAVIVIAEGIRTASGAPIFQHTDPNQRDACDRPLVGDVAAYLASVVSRELKIRCRTEKPGLCGRASILHVSKQDQAR
jgi:6-phosphofructokinase 1